MVYNVRNVKLDRTNDNSVATVALVKELAPFTKDALYRVFFSEFYDFADANTYGINIRSSGVIINSLKLNITLPNKDLSSVKKEGLDVVNFNVTFSPQYSSKYTLCLVFYHWRNKSFSLIKKDSSINNILLTFQYNKQNNKMILSKGRNNQSFTVPSSFNGKKLLYG